MGGWRDTCTRMAGADDEDAWTRMEMEEGDAYPLVVVATLGRKPVLSFALHFLCRQTEKMEGFPVAWFQ